MAVCMLASLKCSWRPPSFNLKKNKKNPNMFGLLSTPPLKMSFKKSKKKCLKKLGETIFFIGSFKHSAPFNPPPPFPPKKKFQKNLYVNLNVIFELVN